MNLNSSDSPICKRTNTHPHGKFWTNAQRDLGFVRISKCGSSTFTASMNLKQVVPFSQSNMKHLYCCLRDPHARFASSILETLKRVTCEESKPPLLMADSVVVSKEVFDALKQLDVATPVRIIAGMIEVIKTYGPFDAHHEPMKNFLYNPEDSGILEIDPMCFPLEKMTSVIKKIAQTGVFLSRRYRYAPRNIRLQQKQTGAFKSLRRRIGAMNNKFHYSLASAIGGPVSSRHYDGAHPMVGMLKKNVRSEVVSISQREVNEFLRVHYSRAMRSSFLLESHDFVNGFYEADIEAFNQIKHNDIDAGLEKMPRASSIF